MESCKCGDPKCPYCAGHCTRDVEVALYRIDMPDASGTGFCEPCANDALESGMFRQDYVF